MGGGESGERGSRKREREGEVVGAVKEQEGEGVGGRDGWRRERPRREWEGEGVGGMQSLFMAE